MIAENYCFVTVTCVFCIIIGIIIRRWPNKSEIRSNISGLRSYADCSRVSVTYLGHNSSIVGQTPIIHYTVARAALYTEYFMLC